MVNGARLLIESESFRSWGFSRRNMAPLCVCRLFRAADSASFRLHFRTFTPLKSPRFEWLFKDRAHIPVTKKLTASA